MSFHAATNRLASSLSVIYLISSTVYPTVALGSINILLGLNLVKTSAKVRLSRNSDKSLDKYGHNMRLLSCVELKR